MASGWRKSRLALRPGNQKREAGSWKSEARNRKPGAGSRKPETGNRKPEVCVAALCTAPRSFRFLTSDFRLPISDFWLAQHRLPRHSNECEGIFLDALSLRYLRAFFVCPIASLLEGEAKGAARRKAQDLWCPYPLPDTAGAFRRATLSLRYRASRYLSARRWR